MKKLFNKKFLLILGSTITLLIVLSVAMIFLTKENIKTFSKEGYIIASGKEESSIKYYFDEGTSYKTNVNKELVFTDSSGEKVKVETDNFMHYTDGGIKFLKNGVIMDLNSINSTTVPYYNITNKSVLEYTKKSYYIETIDKTLGFNNIAGRISENKYIFAGVNVKLQLAGNENLIEADYFEINFVENGIIKVENQEVSYQTTAEDSYILIDDNIRIDLGTKKMYYDGEEKMSLSQMTIDGNENIEIIPEEDEDSSDGSGGGEGEGNQEDNNPNTPPVETPGNDGVDNPNAGGNETDNNEEPGEGDNTQGDGTGNANEVSASIDIVRAEVGVNNINASFIINDPDNTIKGDLVLHITNTDTGKRVYSTIIDKTQTELNVGVSTLNPDSNYILSINEETNEEYDTQYFQKLFKTKTLGISLEKKYVTKDTISYEVIFEKDSEVKSITVSLYDEKYEEVATPLVITPDRNPIYFDDLTANTTYNIEFDNIIMDTIEYKKSYVFPTKSVKTLKEEPYLEGLHAEVDDTTNTFTIGVDRIVDDHESIQKFSYYIYEADSLNVENVDTVLPVKIIERPDSGRVKIAIDNEKILPKTNYKFKVVAEYYDNEKYGEFETELSDNFILSGKPTVDFFPNEDETTFNKISGIIKINDDSCTIPMYGRACSSIKFHQNKFTLEYKIINSTEKVILNDLSFDTRTLEAELEIDNLIANTEYVFNLYGDVDLLDGAGLREGYLIGTFRASTSTVDILTVDTWLQNDSSRLDLINVSAKISSSGLNQNLGNSIRNLTFNLYAGDTIAQLKAGVEIDPLKSKQETGNLHEIYYNKLFTINTADTFGFVPEQITDEETETTIYLSALDVLKNMTDGKLQKYYTIEITDIYDEGFQNKIEIENNYFLFETPALMLMEDQLEKPSITADPVENLTLKTDTELAEALETSYNNRLSDTTIVGYKLNATASIDRISNYFEGGQPLKELIYYVCESNQKDGCTIENAVATKSIDLTTTTNLETVMFVDSGTKFNKNDDGLARGHSYEFFLKFSIDSNNDGEVDSYYPSEDIKTEKKSTPKQAVSYKTYIFDTTENKANYKFEYVDIDNALYEEVIYYTIDDELKNSLNKPPVEEETPEGEEGSEVEPIDEGEEEPPVDTQEPTEPGEPTEPEEVEVLSIDLANCKKVTDPSTRITSTVCDYSIEGLSTDSVYELNFKQALIKNQSGIKDEKIGEYIFDGEFSYTTNTITYTNLVNENDNRLKIKINEDTNNLKFVNRVSAYEILLTADGVDDYTRVYASDKISTCTDDEVSYKCIIVDYADIKDFKTKNISVKVTAYYDSGIINNDFASNTLSTVNNIGYILQKNNYFNKDFKRASYIHIRDNGSVTVVTNPTGIYGYGRTYNNNFDILRKIDLNNNVFAEEPSKYNLTIFYANDSIFTKDSGKNNQSLNNKLLSKVDLGTNKNTFKFNSIIPKISVTNSGLVNGSIITIKPYGLDNEILKNEFKEEDGKYYFYLDIYKDKEKTEFYKEVKVPIDLENDTKIELTKYMPDTTYYFDVSAYLLKESTYKKTLLFDSSSSSSYVTKTYSFSTLAPNLISRSYHEKSAKYTSKSDTEANIYLKRNLILTMATSRNIGVYDTRFEIYDVNNKLVLTRTVTPVDSKLGYDKSVVEEDITNLNYVFGEGYYTMKIFIETEVFDSETKAELLVYESPITLKKLADPTYTVTKNEGINNLTFNVSVTDADKVIIDGEYCVVLLTSAQKPIAGIQPTCGLSALELNKEIKFNNLTSDTLYNFRVYADVYTNNVGETQKNRVIQRDIVVSTSTNYGVALGSVAAYGSKTSITLSFGSGVNITDIKKVDYTLMEIVSEEAGGTEIKSESYTMGKDKYFEVNGNNVELKINPEGLELTPGNSYYIVMTFWVEQGGKLVQLNNKNYEYTIKFR